MSDQGDEGRREVLDMLDTLQSVELKALGDRSDADRLKELESRHEFESRTLNRLLDVYQPKPGEFASIEDFLNVAGTVLRTEAVSMASELLKTEAVDIVSERIAANDNKLRTVTIVPADKIDVGAEHDASQAPEPVKIDPPGPIEQGRQEIRAMLDDRHHDEWELVHGAHGAEELPSQLDARHVRERDNLERRLDLWPPKPGEFATLDAFMKASEPMALEALADGRTEIRGMLNDAIREDVRVWTEDRGDDRDLKEMQAHHKEFRLDVEQRIGDYQPWRGEFANLDAFMSATEYLAVHREAEVAPEQSVGGFFSLTGSLENFGASASRAMNIALGAVIGFFVDEPKLTAQQVHHTLQAAGNVETLHAREVEAAAVIDASEHDFRMLTMKGAQQELDLRLSHTLGGNATAEATLGQDGHEPQHERMRLSF